MGRVELHDRAAEGDVAGVLSRLGRQLADRIATFDVPGICLRGTDDQ